jgi:hypothetical protein
MEIHLVFLSNVLLVSFHNVVPIPGPVERINTQNAQFANFADGARVPKYLSRLPESLL